MFWLLTQLVEQIFPYNYYTELVCPLIDCRIFLNLLQNEEPKIYNHLKSLGLLHLLPNILVAWFMIIFIQTVSLECFLIIFDCLMLEGNIVIFKAALAIFHFNKEAILKINSVEELMQFLVGSNIYFSDHSNLAKYLLFNKFSFDIKYINYLRDKLSIEGDKDINVTKNKMNDGLLKEKEGECYIEWNYCKTKLHGNPSPVSVMRNFYGYEYISNNFFGLDGLVDKKSEIYFLIKQNVYKSCYTNYPKEKISKLLQFHNYADLLIERIHHSDKCKPLNSFILDEKNMENIGIKIKDIPIYFEDEINKCSINEKKEVEESVVLHLSDFIYIENYIK